MAKNRIRLNGTDYTEKAKDLQTLTVKFRLNSQDATVLYSLSTEKIAFSGGAAALCRSLLDNPFDTINVELDLGCCDLTLYYTINALGVADCGTDYVEAQLVTRTEETAAYETLNRTVIAKDTSSSFVQWLIASGKVHKMEYCNEPGYIGFIVLFLYVLFFPILKLISLVSDLFSNSGIADLDRWELAVVGCGRYYTVFTVNDMLTYFANEAGLGYKSTILQADPYKDMVLIDGSHGRGVYVDQLVAWNDRNVYNATVTQLLEVLAPVFNADYRIINGELRFETRRWFADNAAKVADVAVDPVDCYCYQVFPDNLKAYGRYQYAFDPVDEAGNDAASDYNDIVEWNPAPIKDILKGEFTRMLKFGPARFVTDRHRDKFITLFRHNSTLGARRHELVISRDQLGEMKLVCLDLTGFVRGHFRVAKHVSVGGGVYDYNRDMKFDQMAGWPELYKRFHFEDDPNTLILGQVDEIVARLPICDTINAIVNNGMNVYVNLPEGRAVPDEIHVDTASKTVTFKNLIVWP